MWYYVTCQFHGIEHIHPRTAGVLNILIFLKMFRGLNQFKQMRVLHRLVKEVTKDMIPFSIFCMMAIVMVGSTMHHLGTDVE
jgi:hypothetical protein